MLKVSMFSKTPLISPALFKPVVLSNQCFKYLCCLLRSLLKSKTLKLSGLFKPKWRCLTCIYQVLNKTFFKGISTINCCFCLWKLHWDLLNGTKLVWLHAEEKLRYLLYKWKNTYLTHQLKWSHSQNRWHWKRKTSPNSIKNKLDVHIKACL